MINDDLRQFTNQVVVVAGAASGIGASAADLISERGGKVIRLDRDKISIGESYKVDVSDEVRIKSLIAEIADKHGAIHALVNSAGITGPTGTSTEDIATEDLRKVLEINLFGSIWLTQAVLPIMKEQKYGRILHLSSIAGKEGNPGMSPYNISKSGLIGYVKGVAKEVAPFGVTINALAPAVIRSPLNADTSEDTMKYMISRIPLGRVGEPAEVAEMIAFAVSKAASFTTGFTFDISGGRATY